MTPRFMLCGGHSGKGDLVSVAFWEERSNLYCIVIYKFFNLFYFFLYIYFIYISYILSIYLYFVLVHIFN